ncbi:MAG: hypothetical protein IPL01_11715 [Acidobacteria bacterium]|nr:hypothetical protein [Acidobacteriota bacterium]
MSLSKIFLLVLFITVTMIQTPETPINDTRLSIHTLVREDIFSGFLVDDMERLSRGEKNIQLLLEKRPAAKAELLAWKGGATLYRGVRAYESNNMAEYRRNYQAALDLFSESKKLSSDNGGAAAVIGGSYVVLADRLPKENRESGWSQAYDNYMILWKLQAPVVAKLPVHIRGELLSGLAQSAQRINKNQEMTEYLDKILDLMKGTPYESAAKEWKNNPEKAASSTITCRTCHDAGRLSARLAALK